MVDLPAPFSPMRAVTSPLCRPKETSFSAFTPGKLLETCASARAGGEGWVEGKVRRPSCPSPVTGEGGAKRRMRAISGRAATVRSVYPSSALPRQGTFSRRGEKETDQKILAYFSTLLLSNVKGSPITASPSGPTLVSPLRPIFKVEPGAAEAPPRMSAMIIVAE